MQLFCVVFLYPLYRNSFRAKKKLKKSVKKFGLYSFLYYLYTIRKIKKVITIKTKTKWNTQQNKLKMQKETTMQ